ncbi:CYTH domain-containing protein [Sporolactobacillus shoreicorticis]|uniref:CYTH domain-containing protein n=1 Tax=Sporolactobacillus shoreicorticis TaxID=1923877 RepID=A0ABW5S5G2_9BACL|nr:CYTH domain-containing protein [Sporolactobacillus shoreicorticis]MCO7126197.1 CYTH domain-containing protein [Sporolactobacillus shoreicorticis]
MAQELEIEYKNMLTGDEFAKLCTAFGLKTSSFFKQVNYYFDTPTFALMDKKTVLRIRAVGAQYDFTLKQPHNGAILETHQELDDEESRSMIQLGIVPSGEIEQAVTKIGVDADQLVLIGELTTKRCQFPYRSGKLFLDHSLYLDHNDYELEYEAAGQGSGADSFNALLLEHSIPRRSSKSKMIRLFQATQEKRS